MNNPHDWNPTNDPQIAIALRLVWGHCAEIHRGQTPDEWRVSMGAVEVLSLVESVRAAEHERIAAWLAEQRNDTPAQGLEFAASLRALGPNVAGNRIDPACRGNSG